jgi:hypothetical protein
VFSTPSPEDGNRSGFRNVVFLEYQTMDKVQRPSNPEDFFPGCLFKKEPMEWTGHVWGNEKYIQYLVGKPQKTRSLGD